MIDEQTLFTCFGIFAHPEVEAIPMGSRFVCDPPVMDTDIDYCLYSPVGIDSILTEMGFDSNGFAAYRKGVNDGVFTSWRRGDINLVVTHDTESFEKYKIATHICKKLNVRSKPDRIMVYDAVILGQLND